MTTLAGGAIDTDDEPTLPPGPEWLAVEPCPEPPPPAPVLAPYLGLVSAVLCALAGGWLLLAPYALDYRHGARSTPRSTEIDLATGAAVVAVALVSAVLFTVTLARRLNAGAQVEPEPVPEPAPGPEASEHFVPLNGMSPTPAPVPEPAPEPVPCAPDPNNSLRELLTPLVAALAADLKSRNDTIERGDRP